MRQRRKAGPEIVERKADALVLQAGDDRSRQLEVGEQRAFGDLDHQPFGRESRFGQQPDDSLGQPLSASCIGEMLTASVIAGSHRGNRASACGDDLFGQARDQAISSATGMNVVGRDHSRQRMIPPRQHFEPDDLAGRQVHLRLEIGQELLVIEPEADALLDLDMGDQRPLHPAVEPDRARGAPAAAWSSAMSARRSRSGSCDVGAAPPRSRHRRRPGASCRRLRTGW